MSESAHPRAAIFESPANDAHGRLIALILVGGTWLVMTALAAINVAFRFPKQAIWPAVNVALLALAAAALTLAVRRIRHRTRIADAFFSLVLLNPLLYSRHAHSPNHALNHTLVGTAILGLMAGAIVAMKRDNFLRYLAVTLLALTLTFLSDTFIMLLPALVAWLLLTGYLLARRPHPALRTRGFLIMALGEVGLLIFGLACILIEPTPSPPPAALFASIVSFADFPLLVLAIVMLALGWRKGPHGTTPPHFAGMLALLVGLLTMFLNNFQSGTLPAPSIDQTAIVLCLVYIVFALHGPRRLQWLAPPVLLVVAILSTLFH